VRQSALNQQETDKALLNAVVKRVVQENFVDVRDQMFYVIQGVTILTRAKIIISDKLFNIDF
jgi:hypothetical protein